MCWYHNNKTGKKSILRSMGRTPMDSMPNQEKWQLQLAHIVKFIKTRRKELNNYVIKAGEERLIKYAEPFITRCPPCDHWNTGSNGWKTLLEVMSACWHKFCRTEEKGEENEIINENGWIHKTYANKSVLSYYKIITKFYTTHIIASYEVH